MEPSTRDMIDAVLDQARWCWRCWVGRLGCWLWDWKLCLAPVDWLCSRHYNIIVAEVERRLAR